MLIVDVVGVVDGGKCQSLGAGAQTQRPAVIPAPQVLDSSSVRHEYNDL